MRPLGSLVNSSYKWSFLLLIIGLAFSGLFFIYLAGEVRFELTKHGGIKTRCLGPLGDSPIKLVLLVLPTGLEPVSADYLSLRGISSPLFH